MIIFQSLFWDYGGSSSEIVDVENENNEEDEEDNDREEYSDQEEVNNSGRECYNEQKSNREDSARGSDNQ